VSHRPSRCKVYRDKLNGCGDITILFVFKMATVCHLEFFKIPNSQMLVNIKVRTGAGYHRAKFQRNSLNGRGDTATLIFLLAAVRYLGV